MSWAIFFCGSKRIANLMHRENDTYEGDEALIFDWIFYHDVVYKFCIRHWMQRERDHRLLAAQRKIISKAVFDPSRQTVSTCLHRQQS